MNMSMVREAEAAEASVTAASELLGSVLQTVNVKCSLKQVSLHIFPFNEAMFSVPLYLMALIMYQLVYLICLLGSSLGSKS